MKVYDIVKLTEGLDIRSVNGGYEIFDTETGSRARNTIIYPDEGSAEEARDRLRSNTRSRPTADPAQRNAAERPSASADIRADVRPGTPTTDKLSASERRRLARRGSITRSGVTYSRAQIAAADAEAARMANSTAGRDVRPGDDRVRPASGDRNPSPPSDTSNNTPPGFIRKLWNRLWSAVRVVIGPAGANAINAAINISAVEDSLDAYLRALRDYARSLESAADRQKFLNDMENDNPPAAISGAYVQTVERLSELLIEAIVGMIVGGISAAAAIKLLTLAGLSSGGIGIILSLVAGGLFAIAGTNGVYRILEQAGINDWIENQLARRFFTPGAIFDIARVTDGAQEFFGSVLDWIYVGDLVRDSMYIEQAEEIQISKIDADAAEKNLKRLVKSNPKLMQAYQDGKEEAKQILRSVSD